jgi:hypothetical protein
LAVADLHVDRVDEHHRVNPIQGPGEPVVHLLDHGVGDLADRLLRHRGPIHLGEVRRDLPSREPTRAQRQHHAVDSFETTLPFADRGRRERPVPVAGHVDRDRPDLGDHGLRPCPVAAVATIPAHRVVLRVAEMLVHLDLEARLEHQFRDVAEQAPRTDQVDPSA